MDTPCEERRLRAVEVVDAVAVWNEAESETETSTAESRNRSERSISGNSTDGFFKHIHDSRPIPEERASNVVAREHNTHFSKAYDAEPCCLLP